MIATPATDPSVAAPLAPMKTPAPAAINGAARPPVSPVSKHSACLDQIVAYSLQSDAIEKKLTAIMRHIAQLGMIYTTRR